MQEYKRLQHEFPPVYDSHSTILILGSFPSVKSREVQFYYGHPQNRFWKVLAAVVENTGLSGGVSQMRAGDKDLKGSDGKAAGKAALEPPQTIAEKKAFLLRHGIALWDVIAQCEIAGSSDSSIRNAVPVDLSVILDRAPIQSIYANGNKAYELYQKYLRPVTGLACERLPSTSPANAAYSLERLTACWSRGLCAPHATMPVTGHCVQ